jgi:hypothetical protein
MSRPTTLPPPWSYLADQCGGVLLLAAEFKVNRSTLKRWADGELVPCKAHEEMILDLFEKFSLTPPEFPRA